MTTEIDRMLRQQGPVRRMPVSAMWGSSHHDQCWREHLGCAIRRIETLERLLAEERMKHAPAE
jgi:hypothetical protein